MSKVDEAIAEIDAALAVMAPRIEGFEDYLRLNILDPTRPFVVKAHEDYLDRQSKLLAARATLVTVVDDGHPALPPYEVPAGALADLLANRDTILEALTQFVPETAQTLNPVVGQPELK